MTVLGHWYLYLEYGVNLAREHPKMFPGAHLKVAPVPVALPGGMVLLWVGKGLSHPPLPEILSPCCQIVAEALVTYESEESPGGDGDAERAVQAQEEGGIVTLGHAISSPLFHQHRLVPPIVVAGAFSLEGNVKETSSMQDPAEVTLYQGIQLRLVCQCK